MTPLLFAERIASPYQPTVPIEELVVELNSIHHSIEAPLYDREHPEIFEQLPAQWEKMATIALRHLIGRSPLRILDYGSGTGFAASQMARLLSRNWPATFTCYDPSPEMLEICRDRMSPMGFPVSYVVQEPQRSSFDLLLTNSVLHHLPSLDRFCVKAAQLLDGNGVWIAGHEPNRAYYLNDECLKLARRARLVWRMRRLLSLTQVLGLARQKLGLTKSLGELTAQRAVQMGLFLRLPPAAVVDRLVDFSVAHNRKEALSGRGLDWGHIAQLIPVSNNVLFSCSYNYLGPLYSRNLERLHLAQIRRIQNRFPDCGANTSAIFRLAD